MTNASTARDILIEDVMTMTATRNAQTITEGTGMSGTTPRNMTDAETTDAKGTETSDGIKREDSPVEKNAEKQQGIATQHRYRITGKSKTIVGYYPPPKPETKENQVTTTKCIVTIAGKRGTTVVNAQSR